MKKADIPNYIEQHIRNNIANYRSNTIERFDNTLALSIKIKDIAKYLKTNNINDVILGISGGIDSTVVLALLCEVKRQYIPTLNIHGYCITFDSVYGDVFESKYVKLLRDRYSSDATISIIDCSETLKIMFGELRLNTFCKELMAQSSYALRYQMLFTFAQADKGITIGTTNRDEFEYAGWFGKNSDMVVDLQVITNWHKFEVVHAAKMLKVPREIIDRVPVGDLIDGSTDEENFGCTYDELAFIGSRLKLNYFTEGVLQKTKYKKLVELHEKNKHKYQGQTFNPIFIN